MKQKVVLICLVVLSVSPLISFAQFGNIMNKVKTKVEQRIDRKIDKSIDQTLDKAEGGASNVPPAPAAKPSPSGSETVAAPKTSQPENKEKEPQETILTSYSKYDFIPGEQILYTEDFDQDQIGELPLNWNTGGKAELVSLNTMPGKWLRLYQNALYLTSNKNEFTTNFTVEFDLVLQLKNLGYTYPYVSCGLFSGNGKAPNDNLFLNDYHKFQSAEILSDHLPADKVA